MNKHWKAHSFVVGSLLLIAPGIMVAREPKLQNPCKDLRIDLDNQVNSLHRQQNDELAQCRQTNGKNADVCSELKAQQQLALRQLRDQRQSELDRCNPRLNGSSVQSGRTESCNSAAYQDQDNDRYPPKKHPEPPYPPKPNPPNAHNPPPKHDGGGHRGDPDAGPTRNAGGSGSQHGSDHSSGSSSSSSGGGSGSSSHSGSSSGSSSSSGSGSSGSSSSSNSSSSSSNSSSNSSNNSSSGSSNSPPASSAPAPSSAPSHSSGGRPPQ
jgi:hypothetical protein